MTIRDELFADDGIMFTYNEDDQPKLIKNFTEAFRELGLLALINIMILARSHCNVIN